MGIIKPALMLSGGLLSLVFRLLSRASVRRWVLPILLWEGADFFVRYLAFALKVRAANFLVGYRGDEIEVSSALAELKLTRAELGRLNTAEQIALAEKTADARSRRVAI